MIIALIGIDGSGKSTQARFLAQALKRKRLKVRLVYAGNTGIRLGRSHSLYMSIFIDILVHRVLKTNKDEFYKKYQRLIKLEDLLLFANYILLVVPKLYLFNKLYDVVLTDRYVYDYLLSHMIISRNYSRRLANILLRITPKPKLTIVLDVSEETAYIRKRGEKPLHILKLLRKGYLRLAKIIGAIVVGSHVEAKSTLRGLWQLVIKCISDHGH